MSAFEWHWVQVSAMELITSSNWTIIQHLGSLTCAYFQSKTLVCTHLHSFALTCMWGVCERMWALKLTHLCLFQMKNAQLHSLALIRTHLCSPSLLWTHLHSFALTSIWGVLSACECMWAHVSACECKWALFNTNECIFQILIVVCSLEYAMSGLHNWKVLQCIHISKGHSRGLWRS